ncbi:MAG: diguanylate cyclase domain-containing protein [Candidatus Sulfotelmatobacter sp.]
MPHLLDDSDLCRDILEKLPSALCIFDMKNRIVLWSDGAERVTGHTRHETIGRVCVAEPLAHHGESKCEFCGDQSPAAQTIRTSHSIESAGFLHHKAGHELPVIVRAVPIHNAHGSIIGAVETLEEQASASIEHLDHGLKVPGCVDDITGLATHAVMQSHLREALGTFHELHLPFSVACFALQGLDRFRASFGLEASSSLLRVTGRSLEAATWGTDSAGRWSDDQFLVILNGCPESAVGAVGDRLRGMLAANSIEWWGERRSLPVSVGMTSARNGDTVESLVMRAEQSLNQYSPERSRAAASGTPSSSST